MHVVTARANGLHPLSFEGQWPELMW